MVDFWTFRKNLKALTDDVIIETAIKVTDDNQAIKLNQDQLIKGYDSNGVKMKKYTKNTINIKKAEGGYISPSGRIALKNKGDFFNDMKVFKEVDFMAIFSTDKKYNLLIDRYGKDPLGLTEKDTDKLLTSSQKELTEALEKKLFK